MSKRGSKRGSISNTANQRLLRPSPFSLSPLSLPSTPIADSWHWIGDLTEVEDRRVYHPEQDQRPAKTIRGNGARLRAKLHNAPLQAIGFENPKKVLICYRRKARREVIHALKLTGKGARGRKHRNFHSNTWCK